MLNPFHPTFILACNNRRRMSDKGSNINPTRRLVLLAGLAGSMMLGYGSAMAQGPAPSASGVYKVVVRGYYSGDGWATVTAGGSVSIVATVKDDNGAGGQLIANQIGLVGDHFKGPGTVMGGTMTVSGRVEAADPAPPGGAKGGDPADPNAGRVVTDGRIAATFTVNGPIKRVGRIAGAKVNPPAGN
jgi:hypothetical protein